MPIISPARFTRAQSLGLIAVAREVTLNGKSASLHFLGQPRNIFTAVRQYQILSEVELQGSAV